MARKSKSHPAERPIAGTLLPAAVAFLIFIVGLHLVGAAFPSAMTWGFHFLAFLPSWYLFTFLSLAAFAAWYCCRGTVERDLQTVSHVMTNRPKLFFLMATALFLFAAIMLRQKVFLLGDNFVFINNYENTFKGLHPLKPTHEPLSIQYFYWVIRILGTVKFPEMLRAFQIGEAVLAVGFMLNAYLIVRSLMKEPIDQLIAFLVLAAMPFTQLFLGYPESYAFSLFMLSGFILASLYSLQGKVPFWVVTLAFLLLFFSHYLNALLLPALAYLGFLEYRRRGMRHVGMGVVLPGMVLFIVLFVAEFDISRLYPVMSHSHYLSLTRTDDGFQAYTLLSWEHLIDLLNYLLLMAPASLFMIGIALVQKNKEFRHGIEERFLLACSLGFVAALFIMKFDLGLARDWDVAAPFFFPVGILAILLLFKARQPIPLRAAGLIIAATMLHSLVWLSFNATVQPSIQRARATMDDRFIGPNGIYQSTFHLSMAYHTLGDTAAMISLWQSYLRDHPQDMRAYPHLIRSYMAVSNTGPERVEQTYEDWLRRDPPSEKARSDYADFCVNVGNVYFDHGRLDGAKHYYEKALRLKPRFAPAYSNLAGVYHRFGDYQKAIDLYRIAIATDSTYIDSYLNLGRTYYDNGEIQQSYEILKPAARLGDSTAQAFLRRNGLTW